MENSDIKPIISDTFDLAELANAFNKNFAQFADNANNEILDAAPKATVRS